MFVANNTANERVFIDDTTENNEYYCPMCGELLIRKIKGEKRSPHFAHRAHHKCIDSWMYKRYYSQSPWYIDWLRYFPRDNVEIQLSANGETHLADILIGKTIVLFYSQPPTAANFETRNSFYSIFGYKIICLINISTNRIYREHAKDYGTSSCYWTTPQLPIEKYMGYQENVEIWFQVDETTIVTPIHVSFRRFTTSYKPICPSEFLSHVGRQDDGTYEKPNVDVK